MQNSEGINSRNIEKQPTASAIFVAVVNKAFRRQGLILPEKEIIKIYNTSDEKAIKALPTANAANMRGVFAMMLTCLFFSTMALIGFSNKILMIGCAVLTAVGTVGEFSEHMREFDRLRKRFPQAKKISQSKETL